jgi:hypothetical protein
MPKSTCKTRLVSQEAYLWSSCKAELQFLRLRNPKIRGVELNVPLYLSNSHTRHSTQDPEVPEAYLPSGVSGDALRSSIMCS